MLGRAYARHTAVVPAIAKGVEEYKRLLAMQGISETDQSMDLHSFLVRDARVVDNLAKIIHQLCLQHQGCQRLCMYPLLSLLCCLVWLV
jgi:hypothetical protein